MLKQSLCHYGDLHVLLSGTSTVTSKEAHDGGKRADEREDEVIFKNFAPLDDD